MKTSCLISLEESIHRLNPVTIRVAEETGIIQKEIIVTEVILGEVDTEGSQEVVVI